MEPARCDREMRMGGSEQDTGVQSGDQMELIRGRAIEIKTRKKAVEPRTEAQKAYVNRCLTTNWPLASGLLARAKPIWPWRWA